MLISTSEAAHEISIRLSPIESKGSKDDFFYQANSWSPIFTDVSSVRLEGSLSVLGGNFLLLSNNDHQYPLHLIQGNFTKIIQLEPGENRLRIEGSSQDIKPAEAIIIQIEPTEVKEVRVKFQGGVDDVISLNSLSNSDGVYIVKVKSPMIYVSGKLGTSGVVDTKVKDSYNNTLPVQLSGKDQFGVEYTLREKYSQLRFASYLDNKELNHTRIQLELQDMIEFDFNSPKNPAGWITFNKEQLYPISQLDTVTIQGTLRAIESGVVEVIVGDYTQKATVENHRFEVQIPIAINQVNRGRVRLHLDNQSFFESFQIDQMEPKIRIDQFSQYQIEGSLLLPDVQLPLQSGVSMDLRECFLQLTGNAQFKGNLRLVIERSPDGKTIPVSAESGSFDVKIPLEQGQYTYNLQLQGGGFSRPYFSFDVNVAPAIKVEAINHLPYRDGTILLSRPEMLLRGIVYGVKRGLMQLQIDDQDYAIPVLNGSFEMNKAIPVPNGCNHFDLNLNAGEIHFTRSYNMQVVEPVPLQSNPDASSGDGSSETADASLETAVSESNEDQAVNEGE